MLGPTGEGVPGGSLADGYPDLLHEDEKDAGPDCDTMHFSRRPQVVGHEHEQKCVGDERCYRRAHVQEGDGPAREGSNH